MEDLSAEKIRSLWLDKSFPGHGLGLITFKQELESQFKTKLSDRYVKDILVSIPEYLQNQIRRKKIDRRSYYVHGFLELMQADLAQFPKFGDYQYAFCAIDVYTQFLWTKSLEKKDNKHVERAFQDIFDKYGEPEKLEMDQGGEFIRLNNLGFFVERKIYVHFKRPPNKAVFIGKKKFLIAYFSHGK